MTEQKVYKCHLEFGKKFVAWLISKQETPKEGDEPAIYPVKVIGESIGDLYAYPDGRREWHADIDLLKQTRFKTGCTYTIVDLHDGTIRTDCDRLFPIQCAIDTIIMNGENVIECNERDKFPAALFRLREAVKAAARKYGLRALLPSYEYRGPGGVIVQDGWRLIMGRGYFEKTGDEKDVLAERRVMPFSLEECDDLIKELTAWVEEQALKITKC